MITNIHRDTAERQRLLRLCTQLTGNSDAAEDLVQETLLEAWRHEQNLRDPERRVQWLSGIARNVYLRWKRQRGRMLDRIEQTPLEPDELAADTDLELELERAELATLLDRALTLLPAEARGALIGHYVEGLPLSELAARSGVRANTMAVRLHRGKIALRRVLSTQLPEDADAYGLPLSANSGFRPTAIWCFLCGKRRLSARLDHDREELFLHCEGCCASPHTYVVRSQLPGVFTGFMRFRPAYRRAVRFLYEYNWRAISERHARCLGCGHSVPVVPINPEDLPFAALGEHGVFMRCPRCASINQSPLRYMALSMPEMQQFWKEHPRLRLLPERTLELDGRPALLLGAESMSDNAGIEVICDAGTQTILSIQSR